MKHKTAPIVIISLILGFVFDWFIVGKPPGISVFLYASLILGSTYFLAWQFKSRLNKSIYWLTPVILFFSLMLFVRANLFLAFMNICIVMYLLLLAARLACQPDKQLRHYEIEHYFNHIVTLPLRMVRQFFKVTQSSLSTSLTVKSKSSYVPIIRGLIISLPILFLFILLLSSADLVFKDFINSLFDLNVSGETIFRWCLIGFITSLFTGTYALIFMPSSIPDEQPEQPSSKFNLGTTEASIILSTVSLLFFAFVAIQLRYFFGGSDAVLSGGYTYAEYARKGFFELIAVAAISLLLVGSIKRYTSFHTAPKARIYKWLSGILIAEVVVIMLSAHLRLNLYENAYGFTTLRLFSHLFILWLAYAFAQLLYHIVKAKSDSSFALQIFISLLCFLAVLNLINPDNFIAQQNIRRFNAVGKIDLRYLSSLSEDAVPATVQLLDHSNPDIQKGALNVLYRQRQFALKSTHWQSSNIARQKADKIFRDKAVQIDKGESYNEYREIETK